ncbi:hypothetical protein EYC84_004566 [Monilinia fructicola]|uniref:Uncharacterized protein n=1 Tax=Monilinia fructicola TaxID=38448 RepID=A0A5M9K0T1_MONFR|nr:hypothetical protein EYC84_004566 [Monilinia fructicola]
MMLFSACWIEMIPPFKLISNVLLECIHYVHETSLKGSFFNLYPILELVCSFMFQVIPKLFISSFTSCPFKLEVPFTKINRTGSQ